MRAFYQELLEPQTPQPQVGWLQSIYDSALACCSGNRPKSGSKRSEKSFLACRVFAAKYREEVVYTGLEQDAVGGGITLATSTYKSFLPHMSTV